MGYRTTFVTEHIYVGLPDWFYNKWKDSVNFGVHTNHINKLEKPCFPLSSKWERKFYSGAEDDLFLDIAKFIRETKEPYPKEITLVLLHEDGEIDKVIITADKVVLNGSLKYDSEDCYNWQLGDRDEEYVIPKAPKGTADKKDIKD